MAWGQSDGNFFGDARPYGAPLASAAGAEDEST